MRIGLQYLLNAHHKCFRETNHRKWIEEQSEFVEKLSEIERKERQYATQLSG